MSRILKSILVFTYLFSTQLSIANDDTEVIEVTCTAAYCNNGGSSLGVMDIGTIGGSSVGGGNNSNTPQEPDNEQFLKNQKAKCDNFVRAEYDICMLNAGSDVDLDFRDCKINAGLIDAFGNYIFKGSQDLAGELMLSCDTKRINDLRARKTECIADRRNGEDGCVDLFGA